MIPKISLYNFFDWINGATGGIDSQSALFSEIAQTEDFHPMDSFSSIEKDKFQIQKELFELINRIEFTLYTYGYVNFFISYQNQIEELPKLCELLDNYFEDKSIIQNSIKGIKLGIKFYNENKEKIELLANLQHPKYDEIYNKLDNKINFSFKLKNIIYEIYELIIENPDNFCLDENGKSINTNHTGEIEVYDKHSGSKTIYNLKNGKFRGEVIKYFPDNKTIWKIFIKKKYNYGVDNKIKEWYKNGQVKYETIGYSSNIEYGKIPFPKESIGWYEGGQKEHESKENIYTRWYKNGNLKSIKNNSLKESKSWYEDGKIKSESTDKTSRYWYINGKIKKEEINGIEKYWDEKGNELTKKEYYKIEYNL